jgi:signal peptidase I
VVIFRPPPVPDTTDEGSDYIKRVIGLPGDELLIAYDPERNNVKVHVNGEPLPESWRMGHFGEPHVDPGARWIVTHAGSPQDVRPQVFKLADDEYFVMGDNRNNSLDSRFWGESYAVKAERIRGLAWFIYWSYDVRGDEPEPQGFAKRVANYAKIALTFFTRTRWERTCMPIR